MPMSLDTNLIVAIILILLGIVVIASGWKKFAGFKKIHPIKAVGAGMILILIGAVIGGWATFTWPETAPETAVEETVCAEFDITPSVSAGNGQLNGAKDTVTVGFYANTTAYTIAENDNTTWVDTQVTFAIKPIAPLGAKDYDLSTLYYEVTNPDATVDSGSGTTYYMVTKSGGYRQLVWTGDGTQYVKGSTTMKMTGNETLYLTIDTAQTDMSYIQNTYDPQRVIVKFSNSGGWTKYLFIDYTCIVKHT